MVERNRYASVRQRNRQSHIRTRYRCPVRPSCQRGVIDVVRSSTSRYRLAHKTKVLIGKQKLLLGACMGMEFSSIGSRYRSKGRAASPREWVRWLALLSGKNQFGRRDCKKDDELAEIEIIIMQMRIIINNIISTLSIPLVRLL